MYKLPIVVFSLLLAGCTGGRDRSAYEPATLEAARVQVGAEVTFEETRRRDFVGELRVEGGDRDWLLTVQTPTADREIDVHTPSAADLSVLDGLAEARVTVEQDPASEELSIAISAVSGPVHYLLEPAEPTALSRDLMGAGLIGRGEDLGPVSLDAWDLKLTSGLLRTDSGDVELLPGEPQAVAIDGDTYRAVLLASFEAELKVDGAVQCDGARDRLAFELLRMEEPDLAPRTRPEGEPLPTATCF